MIWLYIYIYTEKQGAPVNIKIIMISDDKFIDDIGGIISGSRGGGGSFIREGISHLQ